MNDDKPLEQPEDSTPDESAPDADAFEENAFDLERRIEAQMEREGDRADDEAVPEIELAETPQPEEDIVVAEAVEPDPPSFEEEPLVIERPEPPVSPDLVDATPEPLAPLESEIPPAAAFAEERAADPMKQRDGETLMLLGGFIGVLAVPVLIGTFFTDAGHARVVNIGAGVVLLAIGAALFLRGRFLRRA